MCHNCDRCDSCHSCHNSHRGKLPYVPPAITARRHVLCRRNDYTITCESRRNCQMDILEDGEGATPRGTSCIPRHSSLSPMPTARESDPIRRGYKDFQNSLMAEGAGYDPASALTDAADYKSAPLPVRVNPPLSKSRCASKASVKKLETPLGVEPSYQGLQIRVADRSPSGSLVYLANHLIRISKVNQPRNNIFFKTLMDSGEEHDSVKYRERNCRVDGAAKFGRN
jgi:hypothetical protein